ncbi:MAG: hypothetical protein IJ125_04780 [Atopobiaceae bacterium]|nr:hypothetical protein [Atopobiaceae bacterium]
MGQTQYQFVRLDLEEKLESVRGKTLGEADTANVFAITKTNPKVTGIAGDVIEQSVLGYPPDSFQRPDILVDGVPTEVKTTGLRPSKRGQGLEAKEPMSVTAVSLDSIAGEEFYNSNFWHKIEHMLIVYYLYDSDTTVTAAEYAAFPIKGYQFHEFDAEELETLQSDWQLVHDFVKRIQDEHQDEESRRELYPLLSSALRKDLMLIDTAPKYPHPPRFRLKRSTVTAIARKNFGESMEQLPSNYTSYAAIDLKLHSVSQQYADKTIGEICSEFGIDSESKNVAEQMVVSVFGASGKMSRIELFSKIGLSAKSIVLTKEGKRTEDMKLFTIDFEEFNSANEIAFEESLFYEFFANNQLLCVVFEEPDTNSPLSKNVLKGFKRLSFDDEFIETEVKRVWSEIKHLIANNELKFEPTIDKKTGLPRVNKTGVIQGAPNFPKAKGGLVFVRGTSSDSTHKPELVNGIPMYKQQVWVKGTYIAKRLDAEEWI